MRKLNLILLLLALSIVTIQAGDHSQVSKRRKKIHFDLLEKWDNMTKDPFIIPLDATIEENCISIQFFKVEDQPVTIQIKDVRGCIIFHDIVYPDNNDTYKIDFDCERIGKYELIYTDYKSKFGGQFNID